MVKGDFRPIWVRAPVHKAVKSAAAREGKTLNKFMEDFFCTEEEKSGGRGSGRFKLF